MHESNPIRYLERMPRSRKGYIDIIYDELNERALIRPAALRPVPILAQVISSADIEVSSIMYFGTDYLMIVNSPQVNIDEFAKELPSWLHEQSDTLDGKPIRIYTSRSNYKNKKPSRIVRITNNLVTIENTETPDT